MATDLNAIYDEAGAEWNVHPDLLRAVAGQESGGTRDPDRAVSSAGARGRMQLMPATAISLGVTDTSDPRQNIFAGAKYLSQQLDTYGRVDHALAAYNAGPGRVDDFLAGKGHLPNETQAYVPSVTRRFQAIQSASQQRPQPTGNAAPPPVSADATSGQAAPPPSAPALAPANNDANTAAPNSAYRQAIGAADPVATDPALSAYRTAIGTAPPPAPSVGTGTPSLLQEWGDTLQGAGQALGILDPPPAAAPAPVTAVAPSASPDKYGRLASDMAAESLNAARTADAAKSPEQRIREAIAPAPNTDYGDIVPLARDNTTGALRFALPTGLRGMLGGAYDLTQGPATGTVTPAATSALAGVMMGGGLGSSPARGTGNAIGTRLFGAGRNEADDYLGSAFRADPKYTPPAPPAPDVNPLAASGSSAPTSMPVPGMKPPAEPLSFPSLPGDPLRGAPPPPEAAAAPAAAAGAGSLGGSAPLPNALSGGATDAKPKSPFLPIMTQAQASSRVDDLLAHFGQGGNVTPSAGALTGSPATLAQATGNAGYAALENGLRSVDPHFNNLFTAKASERALVRNQTYQGVAGATGDVEAAEAARDTATSAARNAAFANPAPVDAQPFVDTVNGILASPDGKRDAVTRSMEPLLKKVQAAGGDGLETDPAQLYGVRKAINDQLSSVGTQEGADAKAATRQLMQARDALDDVIEQGAPGFRDYITQHAQMSRPIDGMRWLQAQNVTDSQGNIVLGKLDSTVKRLDAQRARPGASLADGVTDDQIATLRTLRDDMRREQATNNTKPVGSNTVQNAASSNMLAGAKSVADGSALMGAITGGGVGGVPGVLGRIGINKLAARGETLVQQELRSRLLNPQLPRSNPLAATPPGLPENPLAAGPVYYNTKPSR